MNKSNNDVKVDTTKLANIFTNLDLMRFGWGKMFSDLAATMSEKQAQKMLKSGSLKNFKNYLVRNLRTIYQLLIMYLKINLLYLS